MRPRRRLTLRRPRAFLSYRRTDAGGFARQLFGPLAYVFGQRCVYMDTEYERPAESFWDLLLERLAASDYVLAVIGPDWLDGDRLANPQDFVRRELERAFELRKTILPVLVGGASVPDKKLLPESLQRLPELQAFTLHQTEFGGDVADLVTLLDHRFATPAQLGCIVATLLLVAAAWVRFADPVTLMTSNWIMAAGDTLKPARLHDDVVLVTINETTEKALQEERFGPHWRRHHARVVDKLSAAGAKVITFDMTFTSSTEHDQEFAAAILRARERGTRVFAGTSSAPGQARVVAPLDGAFTDAGIVAIARQCGRAASSILGVRRETPEGSSVLPSIDLLSTHVFDRVTFEDDSGFALSDRVASALKVSLVSNNSAGATPISGAWRERIYSTPGTKSIEVGEHVAHLMFRLSPYAELDQEPHRIRYESIVGSDQLPEWARGKIMLVGQLTQSDTHETTLGLTRERRFGIQLHADVISNLLTGMSPRPFGESGTVVLTVVMAGIGWLTRRQGGRTASPLVVAAVIAALVAAAVLIYVTSPYLIALPLPVMAFLTTYLVAGRPLRLAA